MYSGLKRNSNTQNNNTMLLENEIYLQIIYLYAVFLGSVGTLKTCQNMLYDRNICEGFH